MKANLRITVLVVAGLALLGGLLAVGHHRASIHRRLLLGALSSQIDGHREKIQSLLNTMSTNDTSAIEEAVYKELQGIPSTSLISRSDIRVSATSSGVQCMIDTSRFGVVPPNIVRETRPQ
jgi:hypothetical protein